MAFSMAAFDAPVVLEQARQRVLVSKPREHEELGRDVVVLALLAGPGCPLTFNRAD